MDNNQDAIGHWVKVHWDANPSARTLLYYAYLLCLLVDDVESANIRAELEDLVSIQDVTFDQWVRTLVKAHIFMNERTCALNRYAFSAIGQMFERDCGSEINIPLNGLKIVLASSEDRYKRWVQEGAGFLKNIFEDVPNISIQERKLDRSRGSIVVIEKDIYNPPVCVFFINTPRMTKTVEGGPLHEVSQQILHERHVYLQQNGISGNYRGLRSINILAAPTYRSNVATTLHENVIPSHTIGPINLAFMHYHIRTYTLQNSTPQKMYDALIQYLDPVDGFVVNGILFSKWVCDYLAMKLNYTY